MAIVIMLLGVNIPHGRAGPVQGDVPAAVNCPVWRGDAELFLGRRDRALGAARTKYSWLPPSRPSRPRSIHPADPEHVARTYTACAQERQAHDTSGFLPAQSVS